jgi:hypothetical protein
MIALKHKDTKVQKATGFLPNKFAAHYPNWLPFQWNAVKLLVVLCTTVNQ